MNVMSIMRGGDSFRVPPPGTVRSFEDGTTRGERKEDALPNARVSEKRPRLHMLGHVTTTHTTLSVTFVGSWTPIVPSTVRPISDLTI
nr:hypothetical protein [Sinorhizobium meliloti]